MNGCWKGSMDPKKMPTFQNSSSVDNHSRKVVQNQVNSNSRNLCFDARIEQTMPNNSRRLDNSCHQSYQSPQLEMSWDPRAMLSNLDLLEQKIHQVQDIVRSIISNEGQFANQPNEIDARQQLITTDLTCVIVQLISAAGALLPSVKNTLETGGSSLGQMGHVADPASISGINGTLQQTDSFLSEENKVSEYEEFIKDMSDWDDEGIKPMSTDDNDVKESEDGVNGENLPPGSYEVLQLEKEEILAPHTHFCAICGKGFKRDANLRMHMRGHGDEYKTPSALARPHKEANSEALLIKRYSCPFIGCKRNKEHKNFQPLKTILCVKNHYKRSHCDKSYTCSRCNKKKFSVMADLKTHEKHCGRDRWLCSCGTTFSRKDKLFNHISLFQGHSPAISMDETKGQGTSDDRQNHEVMTAKEDRNDLLSRNDIENFNFSDIKGADDDQDYFSSINFSSFNFGGSDGFQ